MKVSTTPILILPQW